MVLPCVKLSPLGWVISGVKSYTSNPEVKQVLHVRFAAPVDITEFWKTESMGVYVPPCTCEAVKMSRNKNGMNWKYLKNQAALRIIDGG